MTRNILIALLIFTATPAAAQRSTPPQTGRPCLRPANFWSFELVPGNRSLVVVDRSRQRFRLDFMGVCNNLQFHLRLGFRTRGTGRLSCVSRGDSVFMINDPVGPRTCIIRDVSFQTPDMDRADAEAAAARRRR